MVRVFGQKKFLKHDKFCYNSIYFIGQSYFLSNWNYAETYWNFEKSQSFWKKLQKNKVLGKNCKNFKFLEKVAEIS